MFGRLLKRKPEAREAEGDDRNVAHFPNPSFLARCWFEASIRETHSSGTSLQALPSRIDQRATYTCVAEFCCE